ncbi:hypothetical protein ACIQMR_35070 [Streptomyces sp. NPDC091376]|uniref:hypothetical protein n=1 Tax=Streptomyces sp. NPDC091376 TaxID=3365994 RepID=UPI003800650A
MLKKLLKKLAIPPIDVAAGEAFKRGDMIFVRKFYPAPTKRDTDVAEAIAKVEAIGWRLEHQDVEGEGLQRAFTLTFRRTD